MATGEIREREDEKREAKKKKKRNRKKRGKEKKRGLDEANLKFAISALHGAADEGNAEACKVLLEHGADVNAVDSPYGNTPLHRCVAPDDLKECCAVLLLHKADVNARTKKGTTCFAPPPPPCLTQCLTCIHNAKVKRHCIRLQPMAHWSVCSCCWRTRQMPQ